MPADDYEPRALALPLDDDNESPVRAQSPAWRRRSTSFRRTNSSSQPQSSYARVMKNVDKLSQQAMSQYMRLSPLQRVLFSVGGFVIFILSILFLVYNERIFHALYPVAKKWRDIKGGWIILWMLIFVVSFPPLIGYSSLLTIAGFVYGFPNGWYIAASATIVGSTCSFIASRSVLKNMVARLIANDKRFAALALTLKHDGLKILIMIRMCPLPYSLSNGAIATFPTVHWASFGIATAIVSPKLMLHIFIGSQIEKIAESNGKMPAGAKAVSYMSIAIGAIAGVVTGWYMYKKTKERSAQLEADERAGVRRMSVEGLENEYADDPAALEAAETLREDADDISLHTGWGDDDGYQGEYRDESPLRADAPKAADDPFKDGDVDDEEDRERK